MPGAGNRLTRGLRVDPKNTWGLGSYMLVMFYEGLKTETIGKQDPIIFKSEGNTLKFSRVGDRDCGSEDNQTQTRRRMEEMEIDTTIRRSETTG